MRKTCVLLQSLPLFQILGITGKYSKPSTLWTIPASLFDFVFWRLLCSHGTVFPSLYMTQYKYVYTRTRSDLFDNRDSRSHRRYFFLSCLFENLWISFLVKFDMRILRKYIQEAYLYVKICFSFGRTQTKRTRNTYMIISLKLLLPVHSSMNATRRNWFLLL
jgi:hypothetical protein